MRNAHDHPVIDKVMDAADQLREQAVEAEKIGKLHRPDRQDHEVGGQHPPAAAQGVRGLEVHPREFAETVMATAALDPSAGWINGVVGVHPPTSWRTPIRGLPRDLGR